MAVWKLTKMPPKQTPATKVLTPAQRQRRKEKRARKKAIKSEGVVKAHAVNVSPIIKHEAAKHTNASDLTLLAKTRSLPEICAPLRWPGVYRQLTDVKHIWSLVTLKNPITPNAPQLNSPLVLPAALGNSDLQFSTHPSFLVADPVAPVIYLHENDVIETNNVAYALKWNFTDIDTLSFGDFIKVGVPIQRNVSASFESIRYSADVSTTFLYPVAPNAPYTLTQPPSILLEAPSYYSETQSKYYVLNHAGGLAIRTTITVTDGSGASIALPTGASVRVDYQIKRYNGREPESMYVSIANVINAGATSVMYVTAPTTTTLVKATGYMRVQMVTVAYAAGASVDYKITAIKTDIWSLVTNRADRYWVQPSLGIFADGQFMFRKVRVTAASLRVKNVTPPIYVGGDAYGARINNKLGGWYDQTVDSILTASGNSRIGYRGAAADGLYTWMHLSEGSDVYRDSTYEARLNNSFIITTVLPRVLLDEMIDEFHALVIDASSMSDATLTKDMTTLQVRADLHVEFCSDSALANNSVSPFTIDDLAKANMILAAAPLVFENPGHWARIWNAIKSTSSAVLKAAGPAAARAALGALTTMVG